MSLVPYHHHHLLLPLLISPSSPPLHPFITATLQSWSLFLWPAIPGLRPPPPRQAGPRRQTGWPVSETGTWAKKHSSTQVFREVFFFKMVTSLCCLPMHQGYLGRPGEQGRPRSPTGDGQCSRWTQPEQFHEKRPKGWRGITHLGLFNGGVVSVAHGADVKAGLPLLVPLLEELLHDPPHPHLVALQGLRWVRQVSTVDHVL